ncbi:MAG TPA: LPS export ABC transporter permease LptF [Steroidobacteraceae bacterium]|nr:LPS export ABC transporter permease LptF [Steroidobacteraceae bacterium]
MRILQRYLLWEMTINFLGVTVVASAVMIVNTIGDVLARAAQLQYQRAFVLKLIALGAAQNFSLLLPVGLLLGVVLAFGRLYHDSEMAAAQAAGAGTARVSTAVWLLALPVCALVIWLNFYLGPRAARAEESLRNEALRAGILAPLEPGRFRSFGGGRVVVYARAALPDGDLTDVFVDRSEGEMVDTTTARRAHYSITDKGETITLYDGERVEGTPGTRRYRIMRFARQMIPFNAPQSSAPDTRVDEMSTSQLVGTHNPRLQAELQWRIGLPVMTLVFAVLGVPLGRLKPRKGRYAHVWLAVVAFAFYAVLAQAGRSWIERRQVPAALGLWWVHGLFLALSIGGLMQPAIVRALHARRRS